MTRPVGLPNRSHDLTGLRFGRLTVVEFAGVKRIVHWKCRCDCGTEIVIPANRMQNGDAKSCGCSRLKHGRSSVGRGNYYVPGVTSWKAMIDRCTNPASPGYKRYGGRGVKVCPRWMSFDRFIQDMGPRPSTDHSVDRFPDGNGDYEPGNCRWATRQQQADNRHITVFLEYQGERKTVRDWSRQVGISVSAITHRLKSGWSVEKILTEPVLPQSSTLEHGGRTLTYRGWAKETGISASTIRKRLAAGWTVADALTHPPRRGKRRKQ